MRNIFGIVKQKTKAKKKKKKQKKKKKKKKKNIKIIFNTLKQIFLFIY